MEQPDTGELVFQHIVIEPDCDCWRVSIQTRPDIYDPPFVLYNQTLSTHRAAYKLALALAKEWKTARIRVK